MPRPKRTVCTLCKETVIKGRRKHLLDKHPEHPEVKDKTMKQLLSVYKRLFGYAEGVSPPKRGKRKKEKPLSTRNRKILDLIENGVSEPSEIAETLKLSRKTVNTELNYLEKLGEI